MSVKRFSFSSGSRGFSCRCSALAARPGPLRSSARSRHTAACGCPRPRGAAHRRCACPSCPPSVAGPPVGRDPTLTRTHPIDESRATAHCAASATAGSGSACQTRGDLPQFRQPGVPDRVKHVAHEPVPPDPLDRAAREHRPEPRIVERRQFRQPRRPAAPPAPRSPSPAPPRRTCSTGRRPGSRRSRRSGCPSAREARPPPAPRCSMVRYEMHRRASSWKGAGKRVRRTDVEARPARPAMLALRRVRLQLQRREDRAEEEPVAQLARQQVRVLPLPAEPRRLPQRLLRHRRGVDEHLHLARPSPRPSSAPTRFSRFFTRSW